MGFKPKGGLNPSSQFHSVNAIQHNWTERITEDAKSMTLNWNSNISGLSVSAKICVISKAETDFLI